ncbi:MAG: hypothetical protein QHC67_00630 [Sphingobium sp.]|uniref:hypothetical protein n=1 Tax=Sphingobium sp. TaxID=1912891 RepID=UPI00299FBA85|nr:hypothetical protein [Sphingobium sp.]MDX3908314.1 hypothetical protein [Sphingobium sp.]
MALIGWIISIGALLGGLALRQDAPFPHADQIADGLLLAAFLACPSFWAEAPFGIGRKPRIMACLAMLLALPSILMRP